MSRAQEGDWQGGTIRRVLIHAAAQRLDVADVRDHRSHSSPSEGADWSSELPAALFPLEVEVEVELVARQCEAVRDDPTAILHPNGLQEVLEVLAVFLRDEETADLQTHSPHDPKPASC